MVADSTLIVKYLLRTYPGKPPFHGAQCHDWHSVTLISLLLTSIKASHLSDNKLHTAVRARSKDGAVHASAGMDRRLSPEQEALSVMMSPFIENSVYYGLFYHRWIQPQVLLSLPGSSRWCCEACIWTGNAQKCSSGAPLRAAKKLISTMQVSRCLAVSLCHAAGL